MKNLIISILLAVFMLSIVTQMAFASKNEIKVIIDGNQQSYTQPPVSISHTTMVPMRDIFETLGCKIVWNDSTKTATAYKGSICIAVQLANPLAVKYDVGADNQLYNENVITLSTAPTTINGKTMVPLRFVSESFHATVAWSDKTNTVTITTEEGNAGLKITQSGNSEQSKNQTIENKNINKPYDKNGKIIHIGDVVNCGGFYGSVNEIKGSKILVYWDSKSMFINDQDVDFWALLAGVKYKSNQWIESKNVEIDSSGY